MTISTFCTIAAVALLTACAGPAGPMGPAGPTGPTGLAGPAGAANVLRLTATIGANRTATATIPSVAGTNAAAPPLLTCYTSSTLTAWLLVAGSEANGPYCGAVYAAGQWNAVLNNGAPGWTAAFVVAY